MTNLEMLLNAIACGVLWVVTVALRVMKRMEWERMKKHEEEDHEAD